MITYLKIVRILLCFVTTKKPYEVVQKKKLEKNYKFYFNKKHYFVYKAFFINQFKVIATPHS